MPNQKHAGLHHAVWWPQKEVTRPKARFQILFPLSLSLSLSLTVISVGLSAPINAGLQLGYNDQIH